jgi:hypothetical protein
MSKLQIEVMQIKDLIEYDMNTKEHTPEQIEQIMRSIETFGFNDPIAIDENNMIIEGHGRFMAVKTMGEEEIPVIRLQGLTEQQKKAYILAHNKITLNSGFNKDLLDEELDSINLMDMSFFNFDHVVLDEGFTFEDFEIIEGKPGPGAPLPFQGQKRNSVKKFMELIKEFYDESYTFVDLFGGSGLLSREIKKELPNATVYVNDFDDYNNRLQNVEITNEIIAKIYKLIHEYEIPNKKKLPSKLKQIILNMIAEYEQQGKFIDYTTLSTKLIFSTANATSYEMLASENFYNQIKKNQQYNVEHCKTWYDGLNITCVSYEENINRFKDQEKVVFIADPPYMNTDITNYTDNDYWNFQNYMKVNTELFDSKHDFIFFTSDKSNIVQLNEFIEENYPGKSLFTEDKIVHQNVVSMGKDQSYNDYMIFNFKE